MYQSMKKVRGILLIILGIVTVTVLLNLMWYLLYYRNHYNRYKIECHSDGRLLLEGGREYDESIPVKLEGSYFDHEIFYPDKDSLRLEADYNGNIFFDGYYFIGNMGEYPPDMIRDEDGVALEEYNGRLAYADYQKKGHWAFIFYFNDISSIAENERPGQKGLLILTDENSFTLEEAVLQAVRQSEKTERIRTEPVWENFLSKQEY